MLSRGDRFNLHNSGASRAFVLAVKVIFVIKQEMGRSLSLLNFN